jgi:hypothetical protein
MIAPLHDELHDELFNDVIYTSGPGLSQEKIRRAI